MEGKFQKLAKGLKQLATKKSTDKQIYSEIRYKKFQSELHRILYYWVEGYDAEHPWGIQGRPPYPESTPLRLAKKTAGTETRELLLKKLKQGQWDSAFRRLLKEIEKDYKNQ